MTHLPHWNDVRVDRSKGGGRRLSLVFDDCTTPALCGCGGGRGCLVFEDLGCTGCDMISARGQFPRGGGGEVEIRLGSSEVGATGGSGCCWCDDWLAVYARIY